MLPESGFVGGANNGPGIVGHVFAKKVSHFNLPDETNPLAVFFGRIG